MIFGIATDDGQVFKHGGCHMNPAKIKRLIKTQISCSTLWCLTTEPLYVHYLLLCVQDDGGNFFFGLNNLLYETAILQTHLYCLQLVRKVS